ncbi:MAG: Crp/Fnr family transcriptional regulator [Cyclobacteriaceae bacterium]
MEAFITHILKHFSLTHDEKAELWKQLSVEKFNRKDILLNHGQVSKAFYFIIKGCMRMYYSVGGEEKTTFFFTENEFVSSYESFTRQKPASHCLECVESCELVVITQESAFKLLSYSKNFDSLARIMMEEELGTYQRIVASFITLTPEERYLDLINNRPDLIQRIPQYQLATYLGVNAESLSRIKKRIARKDLS